MSGPDSVDQDQFVINNDAEWLPAENPKFEIDNQPTSLPQELRQEALKRFDHATEIKKPESSLSLSQLLVNAQRMLEDQEYDLAMDLVEMAIAQAPRHPTPYYIKGQIYYECENNDKAIESFQNFLKRNKYDGLQLFLAFKLMGNSHVRNKDFDAAEECYNRAYTLNPDSEILLVNFGTLEIQKANYEKAKEFFRQAVHLNSSCAKGWVGLALIHRQFGDLDLSWGNIETALEVDPTNQHGLELILDWGLKDSKLDKIEQHFLNALKANQENRFAWENLGKVYLVWGRLLDAKNLIESAIEILGPDQSLNSLMCVIQEERQVREKKAKR